MSTNFANILSKRPEEVEKPKILPEGQYLGVITKYDVVGGPPGEDKDYVEVFFRVINAEEVEDRSALPENLQAEVLRNRFYLGGKSGYYFSPVFLTEVLKIEPNGRVAGEMLPDMNGKQVRFTVKHNLSKDGKNTYANIDEFFPAV